MKEVCLNAKGQIISTLNNWKTKNYVKGNIYVITAYTFWTPSSIDIVGMLNYILYFNNNIDIVLLSILMQNIFFKKKLPAGTFKKH